MCGYCPVLLLLLLLLCLEFNFAANLRGHNKYASEPLSVMCLRTKAEIRTHLLRKLYEYRLAIDTFWCLSGGLVPAEFSYDTYLYANAVAACCCLLLCCELAAPT